MRKYLFYILAGLILLPSGVNAAMCSNEKKLILQEKAKNISVDYDYVEENGDVKFTIRFRNIPEHFAIRNNTINDVYEDPPSELIIPVEEKNKTYKFTFYSSKIDCHLEPLSSVYVTIPGYNKYYKDDLCKGIEDYKYCYKWFNVTMEYDEWKSIVNKYIEKTTKKEEEKKEEVVQKGILENVFNFINEYYLILIIGIIVLIALVRFIYNKKHDLF